VSWISKRTLCILLLLPLATAGIAAVVAHYVWADGELSGFVGFLQDKVDLGETYVTEAIRAEYTFVNNSRNPVTVSERLCCGSRGEWPDGRHVPPGGKARFWLTWEGGPGELDRTVFVIAEKNAIALRMTAEALAGIRVTPDRAVIQVSAEQAAPKKLTLQLESDDGTPFRIVSVTTAHRQIRIGELELDKTGLAHSVNVLAVPGDIEFVEGTVEIRTSHPRASEVIVPLVVRTLRDIGVQPSAFRLSSSRRESTVTVFSRSGRQFDVLCESCPDGMDVATTTADRTAHSVTVYYSSPDQVSPASRDEVIISAGGDRRSIPVVWPADPGKTESLH